MKRILIIICWIFLSLCNANAQKPNYYQQINQVVLRLFSNLEPLSGRYALTTEPDRIYDENMNIWVFRYQLKLENIAGEKDRLEQVIKDVESNVMQAKNNFGKANSLKMNIKSDSILLSKEKPGFDISVDIRVNETHFFPYGHNSTEAINQVFPIKISFASQAYQVFSWNGWAPVQYAVLYFGENWPKKLPPKTAHANNQPLYKFQYPKQYNKVENIVVGISGPKEVIDWFAQNVNWQALTHLLEK